VGLRWNWREASPCNLLIARRLSVDYTVFKFSISEKRPRSCATRGALLRCDVCSHGDAVLFVLSCSYRLGVEPVGRNCARASCARCCVGKHGLFVQQWCGWAMNVHGYRTSGAGLCCARIHQHWFARPSPIVVTYALAVAEPGAWVGARRVARCNSFEIQTAWSVCIAVRTVLCKDAHHLHAAADSGCNENAHLMCERSNYGRDLVAAEVMALWRRSGDGLALGTHAPLATERRPYVSVCPSVGGNLGELSAGDLPQQDFRGVRGRTSTNRAFYVQVAVPMRLPDAGRLERSRCGGGRLRVFLNRRCESWANLGRREGGTLCDLSTSAHA
jgi:hypothetical protein